MASPLEFSMLSSIISGVSVPRASVLGYGLLPRIFNAVAYNLRSFCTRSFCPRVWPPPYRIFYTVIYNLFSGVSVLGYGLPPIEFSTLSSIEYIANLFSGVSASGASVLGCGLPPIEYSTLLSIISSQEFLSLDLAY